jgi:hypothetical protein
LSTATINADSSVRIVPSDLLGVNTAPWDGLLNSSTTLSLSQAAGIDAVRIGGGSTADTWHFNSTSNSESIGEMADYVANLNATGIVTVDYGEGSPQEGVALWAYLDGSPTDTYSIGSGEQYNTSTRKWASVSWGTVGQWASLRAGTTVASNSLGANHAASFNIQDFEIGNEIYGSWETDEHGISSDTLPMPTGDTRKTHDPTTLVSFATQFQTEINAILNDGMEAGAKPISIGIDSQAVDTSFNNWIVNILKQSASQGLTLGFIADHWYTNDSSGDESDSGLLAVSNSAAGAPISGLSSYTNSSNPYNWATRADDYDALFNEYLPGKNVQLIADEVNSISSDPGKQMTSLVNGLFVADALGSVLETTGTDGLGGYDGFWLWDLHNGALTGYDNSASLYGWRNYGDYGILGSGGGSGTTGEETNELSPDYLAIELASKIILPGGTVVASSEDNETSVDTYAVLEANGDLELLIVNKTPDSNSGTPPNNLPDSTLTEQFNLSGFTPSGQATIWEYGVAEDDAQASSSNNTASLTNFNTTLSISSDSFSYAVPDYTMMVISLTPQPMPVVTQPAAANPSPVTGTTTTLTALGSENGSGSGLSYTWSATLVPAGVLNPTYSVNGNNSASTTTATFFGAGNYTFLVTISDSSNNSTTSSVNVTVQQTAANIVVSPSSSPVVPVGLTQQFSATATDQFGNSISSPSFSWGISGSGNSVDGTGNATLGSTPGTFTVTASSGSAQGTANVIAENFAVPAGSTLDINLGTAGPVAVTASGGNVTASQNGVQITLSGFIGVTVTDTSSNDVLNFNGPLALPFTFVNCGTSTVNVNSGTLTFAAVMGGSIDLGTLFVANGAAAIITAATTQNPTTLDLNSLSIAANGVLDITNNEMIIAYGATDPITTIAGYLKSGYNVGGWNGMGIISSMAQTPTAGLIYALGYADGNDGVVSGLTSGQIEVKYTLSGDANLDGLVNGSDFNVLSANFNQSITGWDQGDFNYDGLVNAADFNDLSANFNQGANIAAVANTISAAAPAATTSTPAKTTAAAAAASTPITSTIPASESDDVVDTVLGKHVATKKQRHGAMRGDGRKS